MLAVVMAAWRSVHGAAPIDQASSLSYVANDIAETYRGMMMAIPEEEWRVFLADFQGCLDGFAVPQKEQGELFAIVESTKSDIVRPAVGKR